MDNDSRITALAQDIYIARHNQANDVTGSELIAFQDQTINFVNQLIPEIELKTDWNFMRTNDNTIGTVTVGTTISYVLPMTIRKLVINPHRDLTIRQDGSVVSSFKLVNPNQTNDPREMDVRSRATVIGRNLVFSRKLNPTEVGGAIVADTITKMPRLSHADASLLDILDTYPNIRQLFVYGVLKNSILSDIVQGGLAPSYAQKFDRYLADCIADNNASADADDADRESFGWVRGVGF